MARPEGLTSPTSPVLTPVTGLGLTPRDDPVSVFLSPAEP
jgi:hypothetical protein